MKATWEKDEFRHKPADLNEEKLCKFSLKIYEPKKASGENIAPDRQV